jgi:hypothetical protein
MFTTKDIFIKYVPKEVDEKTAPRNLGSERFLHWACIAYMQIARRAAGRQYLSGEIDSRLVGPRINRQLPVHASYTNACLSEYGGRSPMIDERIRNVESVNYRGLVGATLFARIYNMPFIFEKNVTALNNGKRLSGFFGGVGYSSRQFRLFSGSPPKREREASNSDGGDGSKSAVILVNGHPLAYKEQRDMGTTHDRLMQIGLFILAVVAFVVGCALVVRR